MPYIPQDQRADIEPVAKAPCWTQGELNYQITRICWAYAKQNGHHYSTYNEVIGALECAKMELYRRQVAVLEDEKCNANGEVYT